MDLSNLFSRIETEFEIELPEDAEATMLCVRDVRDYMRLAYKEQGIEMPSGAIFERVRRMAAVFFKMDASEIRPESRFADMVSRKRSAA